MATKSEEACFVRVLGQTEPRKSVAHVPLLLLGVVRSARMGPMQAWHSLSVSTQAARSWGAEGLSAAAEARFIAGVEYCGRSFVGESEAHKALYKPKPIAFPDPATTAVRGARFALIPMPRYIELELASGRVDPHRAKDLVDVQALIRSAKLARGVARWRGSMAGGVGPDELPCARAPG